MKRMIQEVSTEALSYAFFGVLALEEFWIDVDGPAFDVFDDGIEVFFGGGVVLGKGDRG